MHACVCVAPGSWSTHEVWCSQPVLVRGRTYPITNVKAAALFTVLCLNDQNVLLFGQELEMQDEEGHVIKSHETKQHVIYQTCTHRTCQQKNTLNQFVCVCLHGFVCVYQGPVGY